MDQPGTPDFPFPPIPTPYPVLTAAQKQALQFVYTKSSEESEKVYDAFCAKVLSLGYTRKDLQKLVVFMVPTHCTKFYQAVQ